MTTGIDNNTIEPKDIPQALDNENNANNENSPIEKTFTQAELDEIIEKRIQRERKKLEQYSDYESLKAKADEYEKELETKRLETLSEVERANEVAKQKEAELETARKELEEMRERNKRERIVNEFVKEAQKSGIEYIDDALKLSDLSKVTVDDSGSVIGIDEIIKSLVESKPFLMKPKQEQRPIGGATNGQDLKRSDKTNEQLLRDAADKAKRSGRVEDKVAYVNLKRELGL